MRRIVPLALLTLAGLALHARAGGLLCHCAKKCVTPGEPCCLECNCPCDHRLSLTLCGPEHAACYIETLRNCDASCCERIKAAKKLGCRLHADVCRDHCVLEALLTALLSDPCSEVRRAAAWALLHQNARFEEAVLALYVSSKLDPHYQVRENAAYVLDILTVCRGNCYKELYASGDRLIRELRTLKVVPGTDSFRLAYGGAVLAPPAALPPAAAPAAPATPPAPRTSADPAAPTPLALQAQR
jgi:hypothetical protein